MCFIKDIRGKTHNEDDRRVICLVQRSVFSIKLYLIVSASILSQLIKGTTERETLKLPKTHQISRSVLIC